MQTHFSLAQLAKTDIAMADEILRNCVHCGMCLATCPTYLILADERDSPRGRIYLIKNLLEEDADKAAIAATAPHLDRCLTCLSCETTCPSGVTYRRLIDLGRERVESHYQRPLFERAKRWILAHLLPKPGLFRLALQLGRVAKFMHPLIPWLRMVPDHLSKSRYILRAPMAAKRDKVFLLLGCAQQVLRPAINDSAIELLESLGIEVVVEHSLCCGAISHHLGYGEKAKDEAQRLLHSFRQSGARVIISTTSGCATMMQDYPHWFGDNDGPQILEIGAYLQGWKENFRRIPEPPAWPLAYHTPCSLRHGLKIPDLPKELLSKAGYQLMDMPEQHLCCGSAGTYHLLEPAIAEALKQRKLSALASLGAKALVSANIGCLEQMREVPGFHYIELLNWAQNGKRPEGWMDGDEKDFSGTSFLADRVLDAIFAPRRSKR